MDNTTKLGRRRFLSHVAATGAGALLHRSALGLVPRRAMFRPLDPSPFASYITLFRQQELTATGVHADDPWPWMQQNVPWFETSDRDVEEVYYFRWYSLHKHIVSTERGRLLTEFLLPVKWAGYGQTIADAVPHHLREVRWLRQDTVATDYARFWCSPEATPRNFSLALANAVRSVALVQGSTQLGTQCFPALAENYKQWEATQQDKNGLFWSIDTRDGMEVSISGDGYRPTLNSYMYGDAVALAAMAAETGDRQGATQWQAKADAQRARVEDQLWNPADAFYQVRSPAQDSGIRQQKKFKDRGTSLQLAGVRELIGYVPWYYGLPSRPERAVAWKQLWDANGFAAKHGPTTAERRSPHFRYATEDQCPWNGPSWAFATTQTMVALGNVLNGPAQDFVSKADYLRLIKCYAGSHTLRLPGGETVRWLDEAQDADTGEWITRDTLAERHSPLVGRGSYYNHSGFADPVITGCVGLRPRSDDVLEINPLLPEGAWSYFGLDVPYRGRNLSIRYDAHGGRYGHGPGLHVWSNAKLVASRPRLGPIRGSLT